MFAYFDIPNIADKFRWCIRKKIVLSERTYLDLKAIQFHKRTVKKNTVIIRKMNTRKPDSSECRTFYVQNLNGKKSYFSLTIQISNFIDIFGPVFRSWVEIQTKNVQRFQVFNVVFKQWLEFGTFNRRMAVDHLNTGLVRHLDTHCICLALCNSDCNISEQRLFKCWIEIKHVNNSIYRNIIGSA